MSNVHTSILLIPCFSMPPMFTDDYRCWMSVDLFMMDIVAIQSIYWWSSRLNDTIDVKLWYYFVDTMLILGDTWLFSVRPWSCFVDTMLILDDIRLHYYIDKWHFVLSFASHILCLHVHTLCAHMLSCVYMLSKEWRREPSLMTLWT